MKLTRIDSLVATDGTIFNFALDVDAIEYLRYKMVAKLHRIPYTTQVNFSINEVRFYFETEKYATYIALMSL